MLEALLKTLLENPSALNEGELHYLLCIAVILCGLCSFLLLVFVTNAPYGRYSASKGWGPLVPPKAAWVFMESPTLVLSAYSVYEARETAFTSSLPNMILLAMFCVHYVNRALVFPLRMRSSSPMPVSVMFMAWAFCTMNGYLQARFLCKLGPVYSDSWLQDPRFIVGSAMMAHGFYLNLQADDILRNLRKPGDTVRYKIPRGGLFDMVSGANFAAEIYEWIGFGIACWSLPAFTFAAFTFFNTAPRGVAHHKWYLSKFENYPKDRCAVIPFLW
jgi:3-oxo-5-alpha-steroid 4-dehydrogenase 1